MLQATVTHLLPSETVSALNVVQLQYPGYVLPSHAQAVSRILVEASGFRRLMSVWRHMGLDARSANFTLDQIYLISVLAHC